VPREGGFEITVATETMAVFCLAADLADLKERLGRITVGHTYDGEPVTASQIGPHGAQGAMAVLLKDALQPNLVQTLEGNPAFVHGGPFANIAHGCNSVLATKLGMRLADYTVTEAGFGADLGAEKFLHIKCRTGGLAPNAVVLVVTRRAFKIHGLANVAKHVENLRLFGLPVVICLNRFADDGDEELAEVLAACRDLGVPAEIADYREAGGAGGLELAQRVVEASAGPARFQPLYDLDMALEDKVEILARQLYGADGQFAQLHLGFDYFTHELFIKHINCKIVNFSAKEIIKSNYGTIYETKIQNLLHVLFQKIIENNLKIT
jgi:formate--tetrahydrofolate ligase